MNALREQPKRCKAICKFQSNGSPFKRFEQCACDALPGAELCWAHSHAASNVRRSEPLELMP